MSSYRAMVLPIAKGVARPLWSVMIPTYNCATYLRETLASVLAQDPGSELMQIEVVDDCSTRDDPAIVAAELGGGRVTFYQQPQNVGHVRNFNTCLQRSQGRLVHLLHGDDCVRKGFYQKMQHAFVENPQIGAAFCRYISMDECGHWLSISPLEQSESGVVDKWLEKIATGQRLQTPSMVVRREVYEQLGGFDSRVVHYGEDWEMWVRIAAHYPVWHEVEPLALYRVHATSLSGRTLRTGENARDLRRVIEINRQYLPPAQMDNISRKARESFALACLRRAHRMMDAGVTQGPLVQMREALKTSHSVLVMGQALFLFARWSWKMLRASKLSFLRNGERDG